MCASALHLHRPTSTGSLARLPYKLELATTANRDLLNTEIDANIMRSLMTPAEAHSNKGHRVASKGRAAPISTHTHVGYSGRQARLQNAAQCTAGICVNRQRKQQEVQLQQFLISLAGCYLKPRHTGLTSRHTAEWNDLLVWPGSRFASIRIFPRAVLLVWEGS